MKLEFESNTAKLPLIDHQDVNEIVSDSDSPEVTKMLREGITAAQEGRRAEARTLLLRVTEADSKSENAWLWLASISEYPEELLVFLKNVLNINPKNERAIEWSKATEALMAKTFVQRGIEASKNNQNDLARQCFLQAIVQDSTSELAWLWLASVSESPEEKISHLQKVLSINPNNENAALSLKTAKTQLAKSLMPKANQAAIAGNREESLKLLDEILHDAPDFEDGWMLKAHLAESFEEKIAYFEQVLEVNPNNQLARANLDSLQAILSQSNDLESNKEEVFEMQADESFELEVENEPEDSNNEFVSEATPEESVEMVKEESVDLQEEDSEVEFQSAEMQEEVEEYQTPEATQEYQEEETNYYNETESEQDENDYISSEVDVAVDSESFEAQTYSQDEIEAENQEMATNFEEDSTEFTSVEEVQQEAVEEYSFEEDVNEDAENLEFESNEAPHYESAEAEMNYEDSYSNEFAENEVTEEFEVAEEVLHAEESVEHNVEKIPCPFCGEENQHLTFACNFCHAVFTLSDLEMILSQNQADQEKIRPVLEQLEADQDKHGVVAEELRLLGIGYLNLKEYRKGFQYLQEAFAKNPNDVMLNSQIDALAIRIAEIEDQAKENESKPKCKKILVVDDSPTVRKLISGKLEKCGHEVICAVDGMDALAKVNDAVPDLVLLDITMPRMDGYQVCKLLRGNEMTKDVPVVMISGKDGFFDKVRGKMAGTTNYITKPFGPETLMKTINEYIG